TRLNAVVSLAADTFKSSGADVKASLLFLQKFTKKEQADFDTKHSKARAEVEAKHKKEIEQKAFEFSEELRVVREKEEWPRDHRDNEARRLKKAWGEFQKRSAETIAAETRALLKERFPYPVFLYEAEKVGITATGEPDE